MKYNLFLGTEKVVFWDGAKKQLLKRRNLFQKKEKRQVAKKNIYKGKKMRGQNVEILRIVY